MPSLGGAQQGNGAVTLDTTYVSYGYFMVNYLGSNPKVQLLLTAPGLASPYQFLLSNGWITIPLTCGSGTYTVQIYENISGTSYSLAYSTQISVSLASGIIPFLKPNQYVNYGGGTGAVWTASSLAAGAANDLEVVSRVYNFTISSLSYDYAKAAQASSGALGWYIPNVDSILASGAGICFDYAEVMTVMLRSQGIPARLNVGWAGGVYHAWIDVYISDVGWVNGYIYFDGGNWTLMDPTFADGSSENASIQQFVTNRGNYSTVYIY